MKTLDSRNYVAAALQSDRAVATSRFLSLEAFRGLAAVMIVLYHSRFFAGSTYVPLVRHSDIFVDFFFILSGFVMAYSYLDKIGSKINFRKFDKIFQRVMRSASPSQYLAPSPSCHK